MKMQGIGSPKYKNGFKLTLHPKALNRPYSWKTQRMVFVNSMSDIFHDGVGIDFIKRVMTVIHDCHWHRFMAITKRAKRMYELDSQIDWPKNLVMGVTCESSEYMGRVELLRQTGAKAKMVSFEPLLSAIPTVNLGGIDWVIVGGESGKGARPIKPEWVEEIYELCRNQNVPFMFKQWGSGIKESEKKTTIQRGRWLNRVPQYLVDSPENQLFDL